MPRPAKTEQEKLRNRQIQRSYYQRNKEKILARRRGDASQDEWRDALKKRRLDDAAAWAQYGKTARVARNQRYPWAALIDGVKSRAKAKGIFCDLDIEWAQARWTGNCEITGISFAERLCSKVRNSGPKSFSASIDRIDPSLGYTKSNCRIVIMAFNALKGAGSDEQAFEVAKKIVAALQPGLQRELKKTFPSGYTPVAVD